MTRQIYLPSLIALSLVTAMPLATPATAQSATSTAEVSDPSSFRPLAQESSILNLQAGQKLLKEGNEAIAAKNYPTGIKKIQEARTIFNQLSNFHQELGGSFSGLDNRISNGQRSRALQAAQQRDEATFQLAIAHKIAGQPELAVPLLIQVIRSQQPTREMGSRAYNQLVEIGFADIAYPSTPKEGQAPVPIQPGAGAGILSLAGAKQLMTDAETAVSASNYALAQAKLREARQVNNQLSNFHQELATSFSGIDTPIADSHRQKALETAQGRDQATYQLALVHRAQNQPELAVPLLVQIIRSQQPTRDLGKKAYAQLVELGFADTPFPRPVQSSNNR
ncbi:MAG: hypothetical protein VKJ24_12025 [Synechococcales bacterium]|nr:hypothetical protein [Synechococcales bacterium]